MTLSSGSWQAWAAVVALVVAIATPVDAAGTARLIGGEPLWLVAVLLLALAAIAGLWTTRTPLLDGLLAVAVLAGAALAIALLPVVTGQATLAYWALVIAVWLLAWRLVTDLALIEPTARAPVWAQRIVVPFAFGLAILFLWEVLVRGFAVPPILMPPPSAIWARIVTSSAALYADFQQTFLKAVLAGFTIGSLLGFLVALIVDRVPFLKRGLLPIGNLVSALPVVGIAPIMVMWFGFDWPSKAAVVAIMTFFPMMVNTLAGLAAADPMQRDLMRTYAADHGQTLIKLRLPAALPFIFNGLKINTTLALIGAIVAEFFGTPVVGMGFRISAAIGRMEVDAVWATIAVAALAGSAFYGVMALAERAATFWHPSFRK